LLSTATCATTFRRVNLIGLDTVCNKRPNGESLEGHGMLKCFADGIRAALVETNAGDVDGFLMIPDDGLLLPWKLSALPADAVWSLNGADWTGKFDPFVDPGGAVQLHLGFSAVAAVDPALAFKR